MPKPIRALSLLWLPACLLILACQMPLRLLAPTPTPSLSPTPALTPSPSPTPAPRRLTICLGEEPNTLYPFGNPNAAARSVLAAIYDGPLDIISYEYQPIILERLPSLENGDVQILPVTVTPGSLIVDADGALSGLTVGTRLRPASCRSDDCTITYDGVSSLRMDQMIVTFHLRPDLTWSDGTPLTADDSVYAYQLAAHKDTPTSKSLIERTQTYEATDPTTVQWWGLPGFLDPTFALNFWPPAPKHAWGSFSPSQLPQIDIAARAPLGWGPYQVREWSGGDHITLVKNPYYFRAARGYPKFDQLLFRFTPDPNAAIGELAAGRCDILDPSIRLDSQVALLEQMQQAGDIRAAFAPDMAIEWLGIGIRPAAYEDGINLAGGDRPDLLADPRTRQAIAFCLDRQKVVDTVLFGRSPRPASFVPPDHPLYYSGAPAYPFDPASGIQLLESVGWKDLDGNPATPRLAVSVKNVPAGTPLLLNYYTTPSAQRRQVVDILSQSLAQCGIGVKVQYLTQNDLYAPGPLGPLFGRRFDLIEYALATDSPQPPCEWFASWEIPNALNHWVGTNVSGYKNAEYDAACRAVRALLPGEEPYAEAYRRLQVLFATDLPAIPLYYRPRIAAARAEVCHFDLDPSANPLWNVEAFDRGTGCQP